MNFEQATHLARAQKLCRYLERKLREIGWHVALTGSTLYGRLDREGDDTKPDIDIVFYPNSDDQEHPETMDELFRLCGMIEHDVMPASEEYIRPVYVFNLKTGEVVHAWQLDEVRD